MTMINTNVGALLARTYATKAAEKMQTSMERLSSGKRINGAADDAAGLAVANKMQSQLSGIKMAIRNSQDGISLLQTADGALGEVSKIIRRMRELANSRIRLIILLTSPSAPSAVCKREIPSCEFLIAILIPLS